MLKNTENSYGSVAKTLHWVSALIVIGLFSVGIWMVELDYYSEWYKTAPHYHKSTGILLAIVIIFRLIWKSINPTPKALSNHARWEVKLAHIVHWVLYLGLFGLFASGYLISTADDRPIEVFNLFSVPGFGSFIENQEDIAGAIHKWVAYGLIAMVLLHLIGAIKHQVIDRDSTLRRMF